MYFAISMWQRPHSFTGCRAMYMCIHALHKRARMSANSHLNIITKLAFKVCSVYGCAHQWHRVKHFTCYWERVKRTLRQRKDVFSFAPSSSPSYLSCATVCVRARSFRCMYHLSNRHTVCVSALARFIRKFPLSLHTSYSRMKSTKHAKILSGLTFIKWNLFLLYFLYIYGCVCISRLPGSLFHSHSHRLSLCVHVCMLLSTYIQLSFSISPLWHFVNKFARKLPASIAHTYSVSVVFSVVIVKHETGFGETNSINRQIHTHIHNIPHINKTGDE